jgi:hypothetical protein
VTFIPDVKHQRVNGPIAEERGKERKKERKINTNSETN